MKSYFTPKPLQPPAAHLAASGLKGYIEYLSSYDAYLDHLSAAQARWRQTMKNDAAIVKAASQRGCVVKTSYHVKPVEKTYASVASNGNLIQQKAVVSLVEKRCEEVPKQVTPPKPKEDKAAALKAKRRRYRTNRKLREAKTVAKLTTWELRATKNQGKLTIQRDFLNRLHPKPVRAAKGKAAQPVKQEPVKVQPVVQANVAPEPSQQKPAEASRPKPAPEVVQVPVKPVVSKLFPPTVPSSSAELTAGATAAPPSGGSSSTTKKKKSNAKPKAFASENEYLGWIFERAKQNGHKGGGAPTQLLIKLQDLEWKDAGIRNVANSIIEAHMREVRGK
jgi:hypothetical protein